MIGKLLSFRTKYSLLLFLQQFKSFRYFKNTTIDSSKKRAYIFLAADYGNLGDVAITYAQTKFLQNNTDYQVIEIPISQSLEGLWFVKKNIKAGDVVTTVGGGNLGDLYDQIEFIRQLTVQFFPENKIISFPQTFDFSESDLGKKALAQAQQTYNKHKNLTFIAREKTSYGLMNKFFHKTNVLLTPDIVLSLNESQPEYNREGVVICMRKDSEKSLTQEQNDFVINEATNRFLKVVYYDTHIGENNLSVKKREEELNKIWSAFKGAELVVTDRLHGMIFCHITNTPCLVFQNNNHKVRETYNWIKDNKNITLLKQFDADYIMRFFENKSYNHNNPVDLQQEFQKIISAL